MSARPLPISPLGDRGVEPDDLRAYTGIATVPPAVLMGEHPADTGRETPDSAAFDPVEWIDFLLGALS